MANIQNKTADKPKKAEKPKKARKGNYFKEVVAEVRKLTWPTRKELVSHTGAVLAFVAVMAIVIGVLDLVFSQGLALLKTIQIG